MDTRHGIELVELGFELVGVAVLVIGSERALELNPAVVGGWHLRSAALVRLGRLAEAEEARRRAGQ